MHDYTGLNPKKMREHASTNLTKMRTTRNHMNSINLFLASDTSWMIELLHE
jgi:hypothetical protein